MRSLCDDPMAIGPIQRLCILPCHTDRNGESGATQLRKAFPADRRIGVGHGDHDAMHTGLNHRRDARWSALLQMAAGFEGYVERGTANQRSGLAKREHFGMGLAGCVMIGLADDAAVAGDDDGPNHRVGAGLTEALRSKAKSQRHIVEIVSADGHRFLRVVEDGRRDAFVTLTAFAVWVALARRTAFTTLAAFARAGTAFFTVVLASPSAIAA